MPAQTTNKHGTHCCPCPGVAYEVLSPPTPSLLHLSHVSSGVLNDRSMDAETQDYMGILEQATAACWGSLAVIDRYFQFLPAILHGIASLVSAVTYM